MARYMISNRVDSVEGLKDFDVDGYKFQPKLSDATNLTFVRKTIKS